MTDAATAAQEAAAPSVSVADSTAKATAAITTSTTTATTATTTTTTPSTTTDIAFYAQYCFHLSPTLNCWCPMRICDVVQLVRYADFDGQNVFFHLNHPIKWVRIAGVVVACAEYYGRRVYTVDDGSGATLECSVPPPKQQQQKQKTEHFAVIDTPGTVVDVRGELRWFRDAFQMHVVRLTVLRTTQLEAAFWAKAQQFATATLRRPWELDRQTVRQCRRAAREAQKRNESSK
ncbi:MAG: endo-1,3-beta glucanase [Sporothrix thermara]